MYNLNDLITYFKNNLRYSTIKIKDPSKCFFEAIKDLDAKDINLITKNLFAKKFDFANSKRNCFDPFFKTVNITLNSKTDKSTICHELGHMIDFISTNEIASKFNSLKIEHVHKSYSVTLSNGLTLNETLKKELKQVHKKTYEELISQYNSDVLSLLSEEELKRYTYINNLIKEYKTLRRRITYNAFPFQRRKDVPEETYVNLRGFKSIEEVRESLRHRDELEKEIGNYKEYISLSKKLTSSKQYKDFCNYNIILLDCLGSIYNLTTFLPSHTKGYYKKKGSLGSEFFANCFVAKVLKNFDLIENTKKYLPQSYMMFEELLQTLYD